MFRTSPGLFGVLTILLLFNYQLWAQESLYHHPTGEVYALIQHDNVLYASTRNGLISRAKGNWGPMPVSLGNDVITCLSKGKNDLLFGGSYNGQLFLIHSDGLTESFKLPAQGNVKDFCINGLAFDGLHLWISCLEGFVFRYNPENAKLDCYPLYAKNQRNTLNIFGISLDRNNVLWISSQERIYFLVDRKGERNEFEFLASGNIENKANFIIEMKEGTLLAFEEGNQLSLSLGNFSKSIMDATKNAFPPTEIKSLEHMASYDNGQKVVLCSNQIYLYENRGWRKLTRPGELTDLTIKTALVMDDELILGTEEGLYHYSIHSF